MLLLSPWILILNGTSSVGKTSLAKEYISKFNNRTKLLQIDTEVIPFFIEEASKLGQHYDKTSDFWEWFEALPKEVTDKVRAKEDALFKKACQRMVEKAKSLNSAGINVIIDTVLFEYEGESYEFFKKTFEGLQTFFVLIYAPFEKLLENVKARNISCTIAEKRSFLDPFFLLFAHVFKKCEVKSPEKLLLLTKPQFEKLCSQLENLIDKSEQERQQKLKQIVDQKFFDKNENEIGIAPKYKYDYVIDTGAASPIESAKSLHDWILNIS